MIEFSLNDSEYQSIVNSGRLSFVRVISIVSLLYFTLQPLIFSLVTPIEIQPWYNIFGALVGLFALTSLRFHPRAGVYRLPILLVGFISVFYITFAYRQTAETSNLFYLAILPPLGFFFAGKRGGLIYSFLTIITFFVLSKIPGLPANMVYTSYQIFQLVSAVLCEILILYFYQVTVDKTSDLIYQNSLHLKKNIAVLEDQQNQLTRQKTDLEKLNRMMTGRELKMIELKKELADVRSKI